MAAELTAEELGCRRGAHRMHLDLKQPNVMRCAYCEKEKRGQTMEQSVRRDQRRAEKAAAPRPAPPKPEQPRWKHGARG